MTGKIIKATGLNFRTVLATDRQLGSPRMATIDMSKVTVGRDGSAYLPAGVLIADSGNGLGTPFPASKPVAPIPAGQTVLTLRNAHLYKTGDALLGAAGAAIGTVASTNPEEGTVTLAAPSLIPVATADSVIVSGVPTTNIIGMAVHLIDLNLSIDVAAYTQASVFKAALPFWSSAIAAQLPLITLVPRP